MKTFITSKFLRSTNPLTVEFLNRYSRGKNPVPSDVVCPRCGAPHQYLYDNNRGRGQFLCKVCSLRFEKKKSFDTYLACPFCGHKLSFKRERKQFNVHFCQNDNCEIYRHSLKALSKEDSEEYKLHPERFRLKYYYREFTVDFFKTDLNSMPKGSVNFTFRNFSPHILGLCLTYHENLGLSTRATARALWEIHQVKTSHVMVSKYAALNNMDFNLTQVIGLSNDDLVSTEYRWLNQIIERLNRTFKFSYQVTNGYGSNEGSNTHVALFVAYYNFLRPHSYTYWKPLNQIPQLERISTMPGKWQKLNLNFQAYFSLFKDQNLDFIFHSLVNTIINFIFYCHKVLKNAYIKLTFSDTK